MPTKRPNILLVITDQQRWDTVRAWGNPDIYTPNLDALTSDSVYFSSAFCTHPVCTPSRYSVLSGLYMHQHGAMTNRSTLSPGIPTFPRLLKQAGYRTAAVGKMHFTPTYLDVGFEQMNLAEQDGDGRLDDDYHRALKDNGLLDMTDLVDQRAEFRSHAGSDYWRSFGALPTNLPEEWYSTAWIGTQGLQHIRAWCDGGNALMVGFIKPHHPFDVPATWSGRYDPAALSVRPGWTERVPEHDVSYTQAYFPNQTLTEPALRQVMARYYASISQIDQQIGHMIAVLRDSNLYDNTMIIFTSDHGEYLGFHHLLLKGGYPYDPLIRVPLLVKFPGQDHAGEENDMLTSLIDVAPTILRQAGIDPPANMLGLDLANPRNPRSTIFVEGRAGSYVARTISHALIWCGNEQQSLLFDLNNDPYQLHNLINDPNCQTVKDNLSRAIVRWQLFEAPRPPFSDPTARSITTHKPDGISAPSREEMLAYFAQYDLSQGPYRL